VLNFGTEKRASLRWKRLHSMAFEEGSIQKALGFGFLFMGNGKS